MAILIGSNGAEVRVNPLNGKFTQDEMCQLLCTVELDLIRAGLKIIVKIADGQIAGACNKRATDIARRFDPSAEDIRGIALLVDAGEIY
jgi:hypothetical protein